MRLRIAIVVFLVSGVAAGCANDPLYLPSPMDMEAGVQDPMNMGPSIAKSSLTIPIKPETAKDAATRMALQQKLGVMVPYVKVGDIDVEVEWTIKNLDNVAGQAVVELNGANEFYVYDPSLITITVGDDAPPTPGLAGDVPIDVPAYGEVDGVFREDQLVEASIDLDQITRGNVNPFAAMLTVDKNDKSFQPLSPKPMTQTCQLNPDDPSCAQQPVGKPIPRAAFPAIVRVDMVFKPMQHMVLEYTVRVRDHRGIVDQRGMAAPKSAIVQFMPMTFSSGQGPVGP